MRTVPTPESPMRRLIPLVLLAGCGGEHGKTSSSGCEEQSCPVGTSPTTVESVYAVETASLNLVDVTDGPSRSGEGGVGYAIRSESTCAFACVAIEPCPSGTVPIITEDCFTCAELTESGIRGGECDFEGDFVDSDGEASPDHEEESDPPEFEEVPGGEEDSAPYCRTSTRWIVEGDFDGNMSVESSYDDHANEPQSVGEIDQAFLLLGHLDREVSSEPGCADVDIFLGDIVCQGTADLIISSSDSAAITIQLGDQTFDRSTSEVDVRPGQLRATFQCVSDWAGYEVELDFDG